MAEIICIVCPRGCHLTVEEQTGNVTGNACPRGIAYGLKELRDPSRVVTSTVRVRDARHARLPVKTDKDISKALVFDVMRALDAIEVDTPVACGDIVLPNVCGTQVNIVATRDM